MYINGSSYKVRQRMKELPTYKEKEDMLFKYISIFNEKQAKDFKDDYKKLSKKGKEQYIDDAINDGIYIHQNPMWETEPIFYRSLRLRKEFPFIQEDTLYVKKWNRDYKILTKAYVGEMYILKLFEAIYSDINRKLCELLGHPYKRTISSFMK